MFVISNYKKIHFNFGEGLAVEDEQEQSWPLIKIKYFSSENPLCEKQMVTPCSVQTFPKPSVPAATARKGAFLTQNEARSCPKHPGNEKQIKIKEHTRSKSFQSRNA